MIIKRLKEYIDFKNIPIYRFEKSIGMSNASFGKSLKKGGDIGSNKLENILKTYPDINPEWLLTGQGEMLSRKTFNNSIVNEPASLYRIKMRPHINPEELNYQSFREMIRKSCDTLHIPHHKDYDFSITAKGDSMKNPLNPDKSIRNGNIVLCNLIKSLTHYEWGEVYALNISGNIYFRMLQPSEKPGYVKCVAFNTYNYHQPYDLPTTDITDLAIVTGVVNVVRW